MSASSDVTHLTMVRLSGTTQHLNTDQRFLPVATQNDGGGSYTLNFDPNPNVLIPGNYWSSQKDNIGAGTLRGNGMTFDSAVRANGSRISLDSESEDNVIRIDFDNSSVATGAALSGDNRYLLTALETSRELSVYDTLNNFELMRLNTGRAPQGVALSSDGDIAYVHNFMDRTISRFNLVEMIETELPVANELPSIPVLTNEALQANVLNGKQLFYDAADDRLARDNYMSCASCHNDGGDDGRAWDFSQFGEGLRNTTSLRGRAGPGHGLLHWSGNFDEVQDFEGQIRVFAGGTGLMSDADFNSGTRHQPLRDSKAGLSAELDALAAYLASLTTSDASPRYRDNRPSDSAIAGQAIFDTNQCAACHAMPLLTDSPGQARHDIGTIDSASGSRLGQPLDGFDTPTLYGLVGSAPYLHDGSAATIAQAVQAHDGVEMTAPQLDDLTNFLLELPSVDALADNTRLRLSTTLKDNAWTQISMPTQLYGLTIAQIFSPALDVDQYASSWMLFHFDVASGGYSAMQTSDTLQHGIGYWIIQTSGADISVSLPVGMNNRSTISDGNCTSAAGCVAIELMPADDLSRVAWNMIGNPFADPVDGAGIRVVQDGVGYSLGESMQASLTPDRIYVFSAGEGYLPITSADQLSPWSAGWMALFPQAPEGMSLLLPATAPTL